MIVAKLRIKVKTINSAIFYREQHNQNIFVMFLEATIFDNIAKLNIKNFIIRQLKLVCKLKIIFQISKWIFNSQICAVLSLL